VDGTTFTTSDPEVLSDAIRRGGKVETAAQGAERAAQAGVDARYDTLGQELRTTAERAVGTVTFGLSDAATALAGNEYDVADASNRRRVNPNFALAGEAIGTVPSLIGGGGGVAAGAAKLTPIGRLSSAATKIVESGAESGLGKKAATAAAGAALEGGAQSAGAYVTDVALGDRDLTAEGLLASAGKGALIGGGVGAGAAITERGLMAAKKLFPKSAGAAGRDVADAEARKVTDALDGALGSSKHAEDLLDSRATAARTARESVDPGAAARAARARAEAEAAIDLERRAALEAPTTVRAQKPAAAPLVDDAEAQIAATRASLAEEGPLRARAVGRPRKVAGDLVDQRPADKFHSKARRGRTISADDMEAMSADELLAVARGEIRAGPPAAGAAKPTAIAGEVTANAEDDLAARLAATLEEVRGGKALNEIAAPLPPRPAKTLAPATDDLEAQLAATLEGVKQGRSLDDVAARARRVEEAVDDAVGDAATAEARAAARELRDARRELEVAFSPPRPPETPTVALSPTARAAVGDAVPAELDAVAEMRRALSGGTPDVVEDIARVVPAIRRFEAAQVRAAETLGAAAPRSLREAVAESSSAAAAHREAVLQAEASSAQAVGRERAGDLAQAMAAAGKSETAAAANVAYPARSGLGVLDAAPGTAAGAGAGGALDAAAALDLLGEIGIPGLPSAKDIPVVGPLLSLYLKARAASRVLGKFGGKLPATVEARAARAASETADRTRRAVEALLDAGAKTARASTVPLASVAESVARPLLGGRVPEKDRKDPVTAWRRNLDELDRMAQPGVLDAAVRQAVPTGDPGLATSLASAAARKRDFLRSKIPRPPTHLESAVSSVLDDWRPTRLELTKYARYKEAADDPAGVLERALAGEFSAEGAETLRVVYPRQFAAARGTLLEAVTAKRRTLNRGRLEMLSVLFDVPLGPGQRPAFVAAMQAAYDPPPPAAPAPQLAPTQPQPAIRGATNFAARAALPGEQ
jgi:hypothetical protein